ncbi:heterokaryon incompatibility protein-domain-containing protein [Xylariaceae sp. FL1019]|nr:heterokaryon incompatibility protein-domain-containing protein [Xylariaceae sp. FL1019]
MSKRDGHKSHNAVVVQDTAQPLGQVRDSHASAGTIVSAVLDIQRHVITRDNWIKSLECLSLATDRDSEPTGKRQRLANGDGVSPSYASSRLRRTYLDPVADPEGGREYVAVSYTWDIPEQEQEGPNGHTAGGYLVESRRTGELSRPSDVRDIVWKRVLSFARHVKCENIWIDRDCIDQTNESEKHMAIQNMHLVYSLARWPIALLTRPIQTAEELDALVSLLLGDVRAEEEALALELLDHITSNRWWQRAWTFQEDYKAATRMTLMIPHDSDLELQKLSARDFSGRPLFGTVPGEICVKSVDFRRQATEFCLLRRKKHPESEDTCNRILVAAGKYNVLLREEDWAHPDAPITRSMSPTIFKDIGRRGISAESDRLAIVANCCNYTARLDTVALNKRGSSLSLSLLALYILNGEILENSPRRSGGALKNTVYEYLAKQSLRSFRPPVDEELTFIKSCRFLNPILTAHGTQTQGHLWRLGKVIRRHAQKRDRYCTLSPLETLATELQYKTYGASYTELALNLYAKSQESSGSKVASKQHRHHGRNPLAHNRPWVWREWMVDEIERALLEGKALRLASLVDTKRGGHDMPYGAVFVGEDSNDWQDEKNETGAQSPPPRYAFTSVASARKPRMGDLQKHVSLEVEIEWPGTDSDQSSADNHEEKASLPKLYIKRWINGLCFAKDEPQRAVIFPWPADLLDS